MRLAMWMTRALSVHIVDIRERAVRARRAVDRPRGPAAAARDRSAGDSGLTVADLARRADLTRPTAHRLLAALRHEGLVDQDDDSGRWMPGPELYLMGTVAASRYDITGLARDIVRSLAVRTEESAFLSVRRGDETVCLLREEGSFPIRSFVLARGRPVPARRRVGGPGDPRVPARPTMWTHISSATPSSRASGARRTASSALRTRLRETQDRGYALNPGLIVEGSCGLGAAVFTREGHPQWALSLTGVQFRFGPDRLAELGRALLAHAHQLTTRVAATNR